jgi:hypothetical protein
VRTPAAAGAVTALVTGGVMMALAMSGGGLASSLAAIAVLTTSLLVAGMIYGWLVDRGRLRAGLGPGIVFWSLAFPAARLAQEMMLVGGGGKAGLAQGLASFLVYQAMVGGAFGLGFVLLHSQIATLLGRIGSARNSPSAGGAAR